MKLFGTSGVRGPADQLFTPQFCFRLGYTYGSWLISKGKTGQIAVAMDPRDSSPRIKTDVIRGLSACGWEISDQGVIPTPCLTYFLKQTGYLGGAVMITGSHITANLNGVKFLFDGEEVNKKQEIEIENLFTQHDAPASDNQVIPVVTRSDAARDLYLDMLKNLADTPYPSWKIVLDTANGTQSQIMPALLSDLGLDFITTEECDIQAPHFVPRDTEISTSFLEASRLILAKGADLGLGFDVDGDRIVFIDEQGNYIPGDYSCSLLASVSDSASFVTPVSTSSVVDALGKKVYRTKVGSTFVIEAMKRYGSKFGFEANGGGISSEIFYGRDGGSTLIKMLNYLKHRGGSLSRSVATLPKFYLFREKSDCPFSKYAYILDRVREKYSSHDIDATDGLKVILNNHDWLLFRGSGNAPEFRVYVQSNDKSRCEKLGQENLAWLKGLINPSVNTTTSGYQSLSELESQDSLRVGDSITSFPDQCSQVIRDLVQQYIPESCFLSKNIVISGMGGSALGGRIIAGLERQQLKIPIVVSTEYHLPNFVDNNSLVVISSYSGNTEETLTSLAEARSRGAQIYILTSGGKLAEVALDQNLPHYVFSTDANPSTQPRMGLGYSILALITLLSRCRLIHPIKDLNHLPDFLKKRQELADSYFNLAKQLVGRIPVLIASEHLKGPAHGFKNQINENAKTFAVLFDVPEANHHLLEGLTFPSTLPQNLVFVIIGSDLYNPEINRTLPVTVSAVTRHHLPVISLKPVGPSRFFESMDLVQTGSFIAYYLSLLNHIDPGPIPWVDWYKDEIKKI
ncbi:MAG: Bifunctional phosphomannomutase/phosphoglucomutase [Candidatus Amesbacteria bacterium GW2011_GWB1_47_19]|nr:MAG: Bifunctional phosphomannomutase/phosphoglucomutase [Candidatus Amesbacteria bacterium GW2011_GWA1_44_24]KKU31166.1 MAG: Bifunctional phosphomannomutase/phosphoglucomutase [Candidatus Amesbacteria bacterium GW2011_GWC1_46_24]KKU67287.1 MAG: Bifunctional phosphomannomutase/phosphoglucomutase [Candidatus Amesbacteria bacterium GW2011_GWB1_47_19]OGD05844.1 MAG: hypothetical protein A2379_01900 [Candidatus Amesbacteria bacterium RIFOXYB1_FULL_47_13]HBC72708.1 hypothetical protein [Candidatus